MTVPYTFTNASGAIPLSELDDNFAAIGQAANIANTPAGTISAVTVQAAINELDSEKAQNTALAASGGAELIGNAPSGNITAVTVQTAINELDSEKVQSATLAASGGSSLTGYLASGTGAVATTVQTKLRESVSAKDFGAVGDGVTDDTAAIQAAIDAGNRIFFPVGTYITTAALNLNTANLLVGDNKNASIIKASHDGNVIQNKAAARVFQVGVSCLSILKTTNNGTGCGLYASRMADSCFEDLLINGFGVGVEANQETWYSDFNRIRVLSASTGFRIYSGSRAQMWSMCSAGGSAFGFDIRAVTDSVNNITLTNCSSENLLDNQVGFNLVSDTSPWLMDSLCFINPRVDVSTANVTAYKTTGAAARFRDISILTPTFFGETTAVDDVAGNTIVMGAQTVLGGTMNGPRYYRIYDATGTGNTLLRFVDSSGRLLFRNNVDSGYVDLQSNGVIAQAQIVGNSGTAIPASGASTAGIKLSSTANFGIFFGSGAPTLSAAQGSLYLRSDGTGINDRMYVRTSSAWTAVVTVA